MGARVENPIKITEKPRRRQRAINLVAINWCKFAQTRCANGSASHTLPRGCKERSSAVKRDVRQSPLVFGKGHHCINKSPTKVRHVRSATRLTVSTCATIVEIRLQSVPGILSQRGATCSKFTPHPRQARGCRFANATCEATLGKFATGLS